MPGVLSCASRGRHRGPQACGILIATEVCMRDREHTLRACTIAVLSLRPWRRTSVGRQILGDQRRHLTLLLQVPLEPLFQLCRFPSASGNV